MSLSDREKKREGKRSEEVNEMRESGSDTGGVVVKFRVTCETTVAREIEIDRI